MNKSMNNDFDFDKIGKTTPYLTPEGFFNDTQDKIIRKAKENRIKRNKLRIVVITAMAAAALIAGWILMPRRNVDMPDSKPLAVKSVVSDSESSKRIAKVITPVQTEKETSTRISYNSTEKTEKSSVDTSAARYDRSFNEDWIEMLSDEDLNTLTALADNDEFLN
jgi:hypothetical protein